MHENTKRGIVPIVVAVLVVAALAGGGYAVKKNADKKRVNKEKGSDAAGMEVKKGKTLTVPLTPQNKSGQAGTAKLSEENGKVVVAIKISTPSKAVASTTPQPAHIHLSKCATIGAVKYPLTPLVDGLSTTTIDTTLSDLLNGLPLSINVHRSAQEAAIYVACGDIKGETGGGNATSTEAATGTTTKEKEDKKRGNGAY